MPCSAAARGWAENQRFGVAGVFVLLLNHDWSSVTHCRSSRQVNRVAALRLGENLKYLIILTSPQLGCLEWTSKARKSPRIVSKRWKFVAGWRAARNHFQILYTKTLTLPIGFVTLVTESSRSHQARGWGFEKAAS